MPPESRSANRHSYRGTVAAEAAAHRPPLTEAANRRVPSRSVWRKDVARCDSKCVTHPFTEFAQSVDVPTDFQGFTERYSRTTAGKDGICPQFTGTGGC